MPWPGPAQHAPFGSRLGPAPHHCLGEAALVHVGCRRPRQLLAHCRYPPPLLQLSAVLMARLGRPGNRLCLCTVVPALPSLLSWAELAPSCGSSGGCQLCQARPSGQVRLEGGCCAELPKLAVPVACRGQQGACKPQDGWLPQSGHAPLCRDQVPDACPGRAAGHCCSAGCMRNTERLAPSPGPCAALQGPSASRPPSWGSCSTPQPAAAWWPAARGRTWPTQPALPASRTTPQALLWPTMPPRCTRSAGAVLWTLHMQCMCPLRLVQLNGSRSRILCNACTRRMGLGRPGPQPALAGVQGKYGSTIPVSLLGCQLACAAATTCTSIAYNAVLQQCFLKSGGGSRTCAVRPCTFCPAAAAFQPSCRGT